MITLCDFYKTGFITHASNTISQTKSSLANSNLPVPIQVNLFSSLIPPQLLW